MGLRLDRIESWNGDDSVNLSLHVFSSQSDLYETQHFLNWNCRTCF